MSKVEGAFWSGYMDGLNGRGPYVGAYDKVLYADGFLLGVEDREAPLDTQEPVD